MPLCHGRGRGFESRRPRQILKHLVNGRRNGDVPECAIRAVFPKNQCQYPRLSRTLRFGYRLCVMLERNPLRITQQFGLRGDVLAVRSKHSGECVPERMPADSLIDPQPLYHALQILAETLRPEWLLACIWGLAKTQSPGWL